MASGKVFNVARQQLSGLPACSAQVRFAGGEVITCQHAQHHEDDHEAGFGGRRFRWSRTAEEEAMRRVALADADQSDAIVNLSSGEVGLAMPRNYGRIVFEVEGEWFFAHDHESPVRFGPFSSKVEADTVLQTGEWRTFRT